MRPLRSLWLMVPLVLATSVSAQVVNFLIVEKMHVQAQIDNSTVMENGNSWVFNAHVEGTSLSGLSPVPTLTTPIGSTGPTTMTYDSVKNAWVDAPTGYATQGALDAAYLDGNYSLTALGQTVSPINVSGGTYPLAPLATLSAGIISGNMLVWDVAQALTITISGVSDHKGIEVSGLGYNDGIETFGGSTLSFTVPASSLTSGNYYGVLLNFEDIVGGTNVSSFAGTGGMSAASYAGLYTSQTYFTIQAVPEPSAYAAIFGVFALAWSKIARRRRVA